MEHPGIIDNRQISIHPTTNTVAGSDTTAISLRAITYLLLRNSKTLHKLLQELNSAKLPFPVMWKQSPNLPYLGAVIQEALQVHPAVGDGLERDVPQKGLDINIGTLTRIPGGCQVTINAWVVHLDPIFGLEQKSFNPERWLKDDHQDGHEYEARISAMKRASFAFGHGSRTCIGENVSFLEIYKLIPTLLLKFVLDLVGDVEKEW